ncbi:hypothetical protein SHVI106290_00010 [Shewanella violacea]|uniref:Uncharacterized protein n=1 Tax=Shewanella violacea (strain JCM 10179 / CIP 106290 / LMG 19151 / DSS12) TaxID=637905 RepID=D4ZFP1_SHEVD|nr:hypothetical protein SVI_0519 [Shewanella violacea DSS12]
MAQLRINPPRSMGDRQQPDDPQGCGKHDYMDIGGRAKQDARAEEQVSTYHMKEACFACAIYIPHLRVVIFPG